MAYYRILDLIANVEEVWKAISETENRILALRINARKYQRTLREQDSSLLIAQIGRFTESPLPPVQAEYIGGFGLETNKPPEIGTILSREPSIPDR